MATNQLRQGPRSRGVAAACRARRSPTACRTPAPGQGRAAAAPAWLPASRRLRAGGLGPAARSAGRLPACAAYRICPTQDEFTWFASGELAYAAEVDTVPLVAVSLTARIRLLRAKLGISQEQLARQLGVSFATVNRWESGRSQPSARARQAAARGRRTVPRARRPAAGDRADRGLGGHAIDQGNRAAAGRAAGLRPSGESGRAQAHQRAAGELRPAQPGPAEGAADAERLRRAREPARRGGGP